MSDSKKTFGLVIKSKEETTVLPQTSVFGDDEDEEQIAQETDAGKKFQLKYGSNKKKDERAVADVLADDPLAYEFDSVYEDIERQRNAKTEEQIEADKEKKPKYADHIVRSVTKRQLELEMVKERKNKKDREDEGDEFKDKEEFVTSAYKKRLEERKQIEEELRSEELFDNRLKVEDQQLWQSNFNRGMLEKLSRSTVIIPKKKTEVEVKEEAITKSIYSDEEDYKPPAKQFEELKPGLNLPSRTKTEDNPKKEKEEKDRKKREADDREKKRQETARRRRERTPERRRRDSENEKPKDEKTILKERLQKVKEILKQRNNESAIFMAKQRYLQRKANGEIVPPVPV